MYDFTCGYVKLFEFHIDSEEYLSIKLRNNEEFLSAICMSILVDGG
jgi:hypothetical protein